MFELQTFRKRVMICLVLLGAMAWGPASARAAGFTVIANASVTETSLTRGDLQAIYLGEKIKWENRKYIRICVLEDEKVSKEFLRNIVGKTPSQYDQHWVRMVSTGRASMPQTFPTSEQVVEHVMKTPNAIGFVASDSVLRSAKTISIK